MEQTTENSENPTEKVKVSSELDHISSENISFEQLIPDAHLLEKVKSLGFTSPTEVQIRSIPPALERQDLIVQARTGSGKTLAYVVPLMRHLLAAMAKKEINTTFGLVVAPTRELAQQVTEVILSLTPEIPPATLIGGVDISSQISQLKRDPRIVVGTPGRILDLLRQKVLRLNNCRYFVLDEADEMLSMGFLEDVRAVLSHLPDHRQGIFVSATITSRVEMLAHSFLSKPKRSIVDDYGSDLPDIKHCVCEVGGDLMAKPAALCDLIEVIRPRSAIIFCNTKSDTQLVEALLRRRGFDARRINSDLSQAQRERVMKKIRNDELQILVATDIAARGLDIEQIELVVNYSIHEQPEVYIHRTGRTGRAGRSGKAICLVGPRDFGSFHFLSKVVEFTFEKLPLPTDGEVAEARLAHLYEIVRQNEIDLTPREVLASEKLLHELGGITEPTEELVTMIAKLSKYTVEHLVSHEAKSLDEELDGGPEKSVPSPRQEYQERGHHRGDDRRRNSSHQRDSRQSGRREHSRPDRERNSERDFHDNSARDNSRDDRHGQNRGRRNQGNRQNTEGNREHDRDNWSRREGQHDRNSPRERDSHHRSGSGGQRDSRSNEHYRGQQHNEEVRLYIGQGLAHGMTTSLFKELALEFAELRPDDLRKLTIRDYYGFVDLFQPKADTLIKCLNGIEYNGLALPVEYASTISSRREDPSGGRRERGQE